MAKKHYQNKSMAKKKKIRLCSQCIYLSKDGDDWICGCGNGFVEPYQIACKNDFESV